MALRQLVDVYPVGWLEALKFAAGSVRHGRVRQGWQRIGQEFRYCVRQARAGNWRAVTNTFNGYLAEHREHDMSAGTGWTKWRATSRLLDRVSAEERARWSAYYAEHPDPPQ